MSAPGRTESTSWAGCAETHASAVYFVGDKVLKLKKPVKTDFLDFTTVASRLEACREEIRLNRRLSPDVYLGVAQIDLGEESPEPAVVMRRLDDRDRLASFAARDPTRLMDTVDSVARRIAALHEGSPAVTGPDSPGSWARITARWQHEWDALEALRPALAPSHRAGAGRGLGLRFLTGRRELFDRRVREGKIRDGHGDLRADHVYLTADGVRIVDCLEFDPALRVSDIVADVAFLAMDLERLEEADAAARLFAVSRELTDDTYPSSLADFYIAQRALVRLKVALLRPGPGTRTATREADQLLELAERHLVAAQPLLACVGGLPGSGKSTLASALAARSDLVHLSSDAIRQEGAMSRPAVDRAPWAAGRYAPEAVTAVYDELLRRAATALTLGYSVVLDASWRDPAERAKARAVADRTGAVVCDVLCTVADATAYRRLAETRPGFSEAAAPERKAMQLGFVSWPTARPVSTDGELPQSIRAAAAILDSARQSAVDLVMASAAISTALLPR